MLVSAAVGAGACLGGAADAALTYFDGLAANLPRHEGLQNQYVAPAWSALPPAAPPRAPPPAPAGRPARRLVHATDGILHIRFDRVPSFLALRLAVVSASRSRARSVCSV